MRCSAEDLLSALLEARPRPTVEAPRDARGLYGLVDHLGDLRYIGSTKSTEQTFYERIHQRHRTGSEGMSHYFSQMYNTGRMWRDRKDASTVSDGLIAKELRSAFVVDHCRAVWLPLPDSADIAGLEAEVLSLAPAQAVAWNRRGMGVYDEPTDLVDATLRRLGWGARELAAIERQSLRFLATASRAPVPQASRIARGAGVPDFPDGPFRFFALDVETANHDRGSICQVGVACVRPDSSIETWVTYVDPQVDRWAFTGLHGISARTVRGAPIFIEVLRLLEHRLAGHPVFQHSGFDRGAIAAACRACGVAEPRWTWRDSVQVARAAWPELRGNGGHGLANLRGHLGLTFEHHDAGEDARAAAEVVLRAEGCRPAGSAASRTSQPSAPDDDDFDLIEDASATEAVLERKRDVRVAAVAPSGAGPVAGLVGTSRLTQGNIDNSHIYLRPFFDRFPADAVGGSNAASAAAREIAVDWGGATVVMTDLDGAKRFFRKRGWIREFFARTGARAGDLVSVVQTGPYSYRVDLRREGS